MPQGPLVPHMLLEQLAQAEAEERSRHSLERRLPISGIKRFKPMVDYEWTWPTKIERQVIERALTLDFLPEARNLVLLGRKRAGQNHDCPEYLPRGCVGRLFRAVSSCSRAAGRTPEADSGRSSPQTSCLRQRGPVVHRRGRLPDASRMAVEFPSKNLQLLAGVLLHVIANTSGSNECHPGWIILGHRVQE